MLFAASGCTSFPQLPPNPHPRLQVLHSGGRILTVDSSQLLPGDVVVVHPGVLPCDVALLRWVGGRCGARGCGGGWIPLLC